MIDYEMLCQTIEDWRAGRRPSIDLSAPPVGAADDYAEVDHDYGQGQYADPNESYDAGQGQYADPNQDPAYESYDDVPAAGYEDYEYDGAPAPVAGGGTAPVDVSELEEEDDDDR